MCVFIRRPRLPNNSVNYLQIIIDGYNFLKTTGMMAANVPDIELEKGRKRLLLFLMNRFREEEQRKKIIVVFDSQTKLKLPTRFNANHIDVRFSKGYSSADELIIELIRANHVPKRLLVVSSDHEIQLCAQRRKAQFIDSDQWLDELEKQSRLASQDSPDSDLSASGEKESRHKMDNRGETDHWLKEFADIRIDELQDEIDLSSPEIQPEAARNKGPSQKVTSSDEPLSESSEIEGTDEKESEIKKRNSKKTDRPVIPDLDLDEIQDLENMPELDDIFPPGYGEDLLDE